MDNEHERRLTLAESNIKQIKWALLGLVGLEASEHPVLLHLIKAFMPGVASALGIN